MKSILVIALTFLLFSCQTSKINYSWTAADRTPKKYSKILVLGVLKDNDSELQAKMETHLADDLKLRGYAAFAANQVFPPGTFVRGDTAKARAAIDSRGFDAVLTIVLLDKVKEKYYVPGRTAYTPYATYYNHFDRYYTTMYDRIYTEGYYVTETKLFWESNFYDVTDKKMIYSAHTSSFDPGSKESLGHQYGILITDNLVKNKIIFEPEN